jgi:hypothetical protein
MKNEELRKKVWVGVVPAWVRFLKYFLLLFLSISGASMLLSGNKNLGSFWTHSS